MASRRSPIPLTVSAAHREAVRLHEQARDERDAARFFASDDFDGERGEDYESFAAEWIEKSEEAFKDSLARVQEFEV